MRKLGVEQGMEPMYQPPSDELHTSQNLAVLIPDVMRAASFLPAHPLQVLVNAESIAVLDKFPGFSGIELLNGLEKPLLCCGSRPF